MGCSMAVNNHPLSMLSPPHWAQRFRSDDVDEVREFVNRGWGQHSRVVRGGGALGFEQSWLRGMTVAAGWVRCGLPETLRATARGPILHVQAPTGSVYRFGRRQHTADPQTVTFLPPTWEYTLDRPPGTAVAISVGEADLSDEVTARLSGSRGELVFSARALTRRGAARTRLLACIAEFVRSTAPATERLPHAHAEARLIAAVADLLLAAPAVVRTQEVASARIAKLEEWIEAHLDQPLTLGRLCLAAGVGERALQKAFESRRGMSPMRYVAERRLAAARRLLTEADPNHDVTRIAVSLGFSHTGRFAVLYRQAFGETPSQTLRRAGRWDTSHHLSRTGT